MDNRANQSPEGRRRQRSLRGLTSFFGQLCLYALFPLRQGQYSRQIGGLPSGATVVAASQVMQPPADGGQRACLPRLAHTSRDQLIDDRYGPGGRSVLASQRKSRRQCG